MTTAGMNTLLHGLKAMYHYALKQQGLSICTATHCLTHVLQAQSFDGVWCIFCSQEPRAHRSRDKQRLEKRKVTPLELTHRHLACSMYVALEALASTCKAERATVYVHHRTTNVLKAVCTVPQSLRKVQVSSHSGLLGLSFTSTVAFNSVICDEDAKTLINALDTQLGVTTRNVLCFPIRNLQLQVVVAGEGKA